MARLNDVATALMTTRTSMTAASLQRLLYWAKAHHWANTGTALFQEEITAGAFQPLVPSLAPGRSDKYSITAADLSTGSPLDGAESNTVAHVLKVYGDLGASEAVTLIQREQPWVEARKGLHRASRRIAPPITDEAIRQAWPHRGSLQ